MGHSGILAFEEGKKREHCKKIHGGTIFLKPCVMQMPVGRSYLKSPCSIESRDESTFTPCRQNQNHIIVSTKSFVFRYSFYQQYLLNNYSTLITLSWLKERNGILPFQNWKGDPTWFDGIAASPSNTFVHAPMVSTLPLSHIQSV